MNIMKHIALAGLFAAALAAQQQTPAEVELATILAVEEQERDLAKARALYRAAAVDPQLSDAARRLARQRLDALDARLDPEAPSAGQDTARERQLREQARALLKGYASWSAVQDARGTKNTVPAEVMEQLLWIGAPAVPEVVAVLQQQAGEPYGGKVEQLRGLWEFLWRTGGPVAGEFLVDCAAHAALVDVAASTASAMKVIDIDSSAVRAYLEHEDAAVATRFLGQARGDAVLNRLRSDQLVTVAERGAPEVRALVLRSSTHRAFAKAELERLHVLVRAGIAGTDPDVGKAAELFLCSMPSQQSLDGLLIVLEQLPDLRRRGVSVDPWEGNQGLVGPFDSMTEEDVRELARAVDRCVQRIGKVDTSGMRGFDWMHLLMWRLFERGSDVACARFLSWWDQGYAVLGMLRGDSMITDDNAGAFLERYDQAPVQERHRLLGALLDRALPESAMPTLRRIAEQSPEQKAVVARLMAQTGSAEAIDWIVERWRAERAAADGASRPTVVGPPGTAHTGNARGGSPRGSAHTGGRAKADWAVEAMLVLGRRSAAEPVRAAMREMLRHYYGESPNGSEGSRLMLALMWMGDEGALELFVERPATAGAVHPYSELGEQFTAYQYLIYQNAAPAHAYSEEQVLETVRRREQRHGDVGWIDPRYTPGPISDRVLLLLSEYETVAYNHDSWQGRFVSVLDERLERGGDVSLLEPWFLSKVGAGGHYHRLADSITTNVVRRYRAQLAAAIDGDDAKWAEYAARRIWNLDKGVDVAALLQSRHVGVREWAVDTVRDGEIDVPDELVIPLLDDADYGVRVIAVEHLGAKVCKDAVPALIRRLRDEESSVREAASAALTRIRFYHEQQAHWDRVLKGVDASPASAAEKLLLQARPGQQKEQRVLAITSLGVLGKPEALPFLIEFSQEADAEVADAAKAAITKIHLGVR